jgi:hypothetical protein
VSRLSRIAVALVALASLVPADTWACAVCGGGNPANRLTFFLSTIALSILPLGMFAAGVFWLRRKIREARPDEFMDRDTVVPGSSPAPVADTPRP